MQLSDDDIIKMSRGIKTNKAVGYDGILPQIFNIAKH